jgi:hypothetical protein
MTRKIVLLFRSFFPICNLFAQNDFNEIDIFLEKPMQIGHIPKSSMAIMDNASSSRQMVTAKIFI